MTTQYTVIRVDFQQKQHNYLSQIGDVTVDPK